MDICDRLNQLTQMHNIILNINIEDMCADWMLLVGSEPDFKDIASNEGYYNECSSLFVDLVTDSSYWH